MAKFIHCADIHLGKIQNNLDQRFEDFGNAFRYVVEEALARSVDFLLIAGDLFDKRNINARTLEQAVEILELLKQAEIPVIAIEGNHDKAFLRDKDSWMSFLANRGYIVLLKPEFQNGKLILEAYDRESCSGAYIDLAGDEGDLRVYGLGYLGRAAGSKLEELAEQLTDEQTNIVLLHAMVGRMGGDLIGSISKGDVACLRDQVAYLGLGHGHNRYMVERRSEVVAGVEAVEVVESAKIGEVAEATEVADGDEVVESSGAVASDATDVTDAPGAPDANDVAPSSDGQVSLFSWADDESAVTEEADLDQEIVVEVDKGSRVVADESAAARETDLAQEVVAEIDGDFFESGLTEESHQENSQDQATSIRQEQVFTQEEDYSQFWGHNPGSTEHCRLDEAGYKQGFYYVEMEAGTVQKVEHVPTKSRAARILVVDISGAEAPEAVYEKVLARIREDVAELDQPLLRLVIKGEIHFDILEIDEEYLRSEIDEICAPLLLELELRANLPELSIGEDVDLLDRQAIEREVLKKKVEERSQWRHLGDDLVNLMLEVKDDVLTGVPAEEVLAKVMAMVGDQNEDS